MLKLNTKIFTLLILSSSLFLAHSAFAKDTKMESPPGKERFRTKICDFICDAEYICYGINVVYKSDEAGFIKARLNSSSEMVQLYCQYNKGLVLPGEKAYTDDLPKLILKKENH
ncbi:hypothetical protein [Kaarinaea lacus]